MSEHIKNFVDNLSKGNNADAGEAFKDALRAKVGDQLDIKRQDVAGNMFQAQPHSDPKPEIAGTGTFTQDGQVEPTGAEAQPETPEVSNAESQPVNTDTTGV